jgi:hypothetical protein
MDRRNSASNYPAHRSYPSQPGGTPFKDNFTSSPVPLRASSENAWANANRAWMIACRLVASRR